MRDLIGDRTQPASVFPSDTQVGLFDNTASVQNVPELLAEKYLDAAATLAEGITNVAGLVGCDYAAAGAGECVASFVNRFGRRAFRRPLNGDEIASLTALFETAKGQEDATAGIRAIVAAVLTSPHFLFRPEFGSGAGGVPNSTRLTPYEIAARLGSLLWASVPDETLLDAARDGGLVTPQQIADQARRLLKDDRARPALAAFYRHWLGLPLLTSVSKNTAVFPAWNDELRDSMRQETERFVESVLWQGDARFATLLTASYSFVNAPLAALYGVTGPSSTTRFDRVELNPKERAGILTQAGVLATFARPDESSPVKRGKWLRVRMLCQDLPEPPAQVPDLPPPVSGVSTRERFAQHSTDPVCRTCHRLIDGLGFGLEEYDGIGRFRTQDQGAAVDSQGEITATGEIDGEYVGGRELATLLSRSERATDCVPTQWLRYAMGRRESEEDACSLAAVRDAFRSSGGDLKELMITLTQTDVFRDYRRPE